MARQSVHAAIFSHIISEEVTKWSNQLWKASEPVPHGTDAPVSLVAFHWMSYSDMSRGTTLGSCLYSPNKENYISVRYGIHIAGCFYLRTSIVGRLVLVTISPLNNTPLCPCPRITLTDARIFPFTAFELKVPTSVSLLSRVVLDGRDWLYATEYSQRAEY